MTSHSLIGMPSRLQSHLVVGVRVELLGWDEGTEQPIGLVVYARDEEECVTGTRRGVVAKRERPQAWKDDRLLVLVAQGPTPASRNRVVGVDQSLAKVAMAARKFRLASDRSKEQALIDAALRAVDLRPRDVLGRYPHQLSGHPV